MVCLSDNRPIFDNFMQNSGGRNSDDDPPQAGGLSSYQKRNNHNYRMQSHYFICKQWNQNMRLDLLDNQKNQQCYKSKRRRRRKSGENGYGARNYRSGERHKFKNTRKDTDQKRVSDPKQKQREPYQKPHHNAQNNLRP